MPNSLLTASRYHVLQSAPYCTLLQGEGSSPGDVQKYLDQQGKKFA